MKKVYLLIFIFIIFITACNNATLTDDNNEIPNNNIQEEIEEVNDMLVMKINDTKVNVNWNDNESVNALKELCKDNPLTIQMSMYGGFEQVGPIGTSLPSSNTQITTSSGDIVLYSGNQLVVFYGSNSWSYTMLGHMIDISNDEIRNLLSNGDVTITLSIE